MFEKIVELNGKKLTAEAFKLVEVSKGVYKTKLLGKGDAMTIKESLVAYDQLKKEIERLQGIQKQRKAEIEGYLVSNNLNKLEEDVEDRHFSVSMVEKVTESLQKNEVKKLLTEDQYSGCLKKTISKYAMIKTTNKLDEDTPKGVL